MIFQIDHINGDMCGNSWTEGEPEYWEAKDAEALWLKLGKPSIIEYWLKSNPDEAIHFQTNVEVRDGMGGVSRDRNPGFKWEKDKKRAYGFRCDGKGCFFFRVNPIKVRK